MQTFAQGFARNFRRRSRRRHVFGVLFEQIVRRASLFNGPLNGLVQIRHRTAQGADNAFGHGLTAHPCAFKGLNLTVDRLLRPGECLFKGRICLL